MANRLYYDTLYQAISINAIPNLFVEIHWVEMYRWMQ
jgi:hypothetical protein